MQLCKTPCVPYDNAYKASVLSNLILVENGIPVKEKFIFDIA